MKQLLKSLSVFAFVLVVLSSCSHSTDTGDGGTGGNGGGKDTVLTLTKQGPDTLTVASGGSNTIPFNVKLGTKGVDSAVVGYYNPLTGAPLTSNLTVGGNVTLTVEAPTGSLAGLYKLAFVATKRDVHSSDTLRMYLKVVGRSSFKLGLRARSETDGVGLRWTRDAHDVEEDTALCMRANGEIAAADVVPAGISQAHFAGLTAGEVYTLTVHSRIMTSETVQWATSVKFGPVRIYETHSGQTSGVILSTGQTAAVDQADLVLATDIYSPSELTLTSPNVGTLTGKPNARATHFSDFFVYAQSMDSIFYLQDFSKKFDSTANTIELPQGIHEWLVFQVITADHHYAQIGIIPQSDGQLFGGDVGARYVDLKISYQPLADVPYAGRAVPRINAIKHTARLKQ